MSCANSNYLVKSRELGELLNKRTDDDLVKFREKAENQATNESLFRCHATHAVLRLLGVLVADESSTGVPVLLVV
jgi:hypothetical protein